MYLKRVTITGFKSFAHKTTLELAPGLTAVVGPNGSGKSNIADAVRWVLGEQSSKSLRTKKGEDVIFAGTDKKAKGSAAEVVLLLDNSDGRAPLDVAEIQISRKLYRSGESEYRLNERKVRLSDLEHLLAQCGFGTESYTVIGQGMVDNLIMVNPAERKVLFDEASGIKEYELKREQALRKLEQTDQNVARVRDIVTELEPRLVTLERAASVAAARKHLATDLENVRAEYVVTALHELETEHNLAVDAEKNQKSVIARFEKELSRAERDQANLQADQQTAVARRSQVADQLHELERERDQVTNELSVKRAELQFAEEKAAQLQDISEQTHVAEKDHKYQQRVRRQLTKQLAEAQVAEQEHADELATIGKRVDSAQRALVNLRRVHDEASSSEYVEHAMQILKQVSYGLAADSMTTEELRLLVYKAGRLLGHANTAGSAGLDKIKEAQARLTDAMKEREKAHEPYTNAVIRLRSVELDLARSEEELTRLEDNLKGLRAARKNHGAGQSERVRIVGQLTKRLEALDAELSTQRQKAVEEAPTDTDEIIALATRLEALRQGKASAQLQLAQTTASLDDIQTRKVGILEQRSQWFGKQIPQVRPSQMPPLDLLRQVDILEAKLQETSSADAAALEEYEESKARHAFLSHQLADLESAAADVRTVVAQLDKQIKTTFEANFATIASKFTKYFTDLFGGGRAELKLDTSPEGAYGIEITAVPPGKRMQSLATLSGGERALTGTALLAAILATNPSPFVVLDEVDAALDEANSGRLSTILGQLTKHSQLIVITHNRQIMAVAEQLYGVTLDSHQASTLLSVKLDAATVLAARR